MEVMSPGDTVREMDVKVAEYLSVGASAVVVVDPDVSTVTVHRPGGFRRYPAPRRSRPGPVGRSPGFRCAVDDIFD